MPKLGREYAAKIALKETLNKSNPPATRLRWFDRFCVLRSFYKISFHDSTGSGNQPTDDLTQGEFNDKMAKFLEEDSDADKLPAS
jgi:hypothetical protein